MTKMREILKDSNVIENIALKEYTTFRTGGPCTLLVTPETIEEFVQVVILLREEKFSYFILGRGSNLLVSDHGYEGCIICTRKLKQMEVHENQIEAECGVMNAEVAKEALRHSLAGFEFASGIPGTVGGGLIMNAGAYGGEFKDVAVSAKVLTPENEIKTISNQEMGLSYRHSDIEKRGEILLSVTFSLIPGKQEEISGKMEDFNQRRRDKQPLEYGSAGSTFKRPEGHFAGALIQEAGLKGFRVQEAGVSEKHAGFVVNYGNATATDVYRVIRYVQEKVYQNTGILLETEVKFLGDF